MAKAMTKINNIADENEITLDDIKTSEVKKRKFNNDDEIECVSITPGKLFIKGKRSDDLYTFGDIDDIQYIRYDDLMYAVRTKAPCVFKPRFIILDTDFLAQHKEVEDVYASLYSSADLKAILKMSPNQMRNKLNTLPEGAKDSLKVIAMTMIDNGTFDSVQRIKILDEVFGTEMLFKITGA